MAGNGSSHSAALWRTWSAGLQAAAAASPAGAEADCREGHAASKGRLIHLPACALPAHPPHSLPCCPCALFIVCHQGRRTVQHNNRQRIMLACTCAGLQVGKLLPAFCVAVIVFIGRVHDIHDMTQSSGGTSLSDGVYHVILDKVPGITMACKCVCVFQLVHVVVVMHTGCQGAAVQAVQGRLCRPSGCAAHCGPCPFAHPVHMERQQ